VPANEVVQNSPEWFQLQDFETYRAALAHEKLRIESYEGYVNDVAHYILEYCVSQEDKVRLVEESDWQKVYLAALVPQLNEEGLSQCLRDTFQGIIQR
jgi:hypothetical protein